MIWNKKVILILVLGIALTTGFAFQGTRGLYESSEGRYAECAREMIETGNFMEPQIGYRPHLTKPPLTYWAIAGGMMLLGENEWGIRLYNAAAFALTVLVIVQLGIMLWDKETGLVAGLIYASSLFPVIGAYFVTTDTLLTLWVTTGVLCYLKAYRESSGRRQRMWVCGMWLFFGLAFLTKGPAGIVFLLPLLIWHVLLKNPFKIMSPAGILIFLSVGFSWYIVVCLRHPGALAFLINEQFTGRLTGNLISREAPNSEWYKAFLMYIPALTVGAGPWVYFLLKDLKWTNLAEILKFKNYRDSNRNENFLYILFLPIIVFFIAASKLIFYVLPFYTLITLIVAHRIRLNQSISCRMANAVKTALLTALILVGVKGVMAYLPNKNNMRPVGAVCRQFQRPHTHFVAFDEPKFFGLQFYLHGHLRRFFAAGKDDEGNSDGTLDDMIDQILSSDSEESWVIVTNQTKHLRILEEGLNKLSLPFKETKTKYWIICTLNMPGSILKSMNKRNTDI